MEIDAGERRGKLAQIGGRRPDQAGELAEAPMRRRDRRVAIRAASAPGAQRRRGWPPPGSRRSQPSVSGCVRSVRGRPRTSPIRTDSARPPAAKTIPKTRGQSAHPASRLPCSLPCREPYLELPHGSWVISTTGPGSLSPALNPSQTTRLHSHSTQKRPRKDPTEGAWSQYRGPGPLGWHFAAVFTLCICTGHWGWRPHGRSMPRSQLARLSCCDPGQAAALLRNERA